MCLLDIMIKLKKDYDFNLIATVQGIGYTRKLQECFLIDSTDNFSERVLLTEYVNKFMLQRSTIYAVSLTSIITENSYSDISSCNSNYLNTEASGMIITNGTIERVYNNENNCFDNYGVFYFTPNKLNHAKTININN